MSEATAQPCGAILCIARGRHAGEVEALVGAARAAGLEALLWALDELPEALRPWIAGAGPGQRVDLLNRLWARAARSRPDFVLVCDDDVRIERGSLLRFLETAAAAGLHVAQPAHVAGSHLSYEITRRARLARARRTSFVEIGPMVLVRRPWLEILFPLPEGFGMGWGLDLLWRDLARDGCRLGIVDEVGIRHLTPVGESYDTGPERARVKPLLRARGLRRTIDGQRVTAVWRRWQRRPPWRDAPDPAVDASGQIPVVLAIDVEPDLRLVSRAAPEPWLGYTRSFELFEGLRERIAHATGSPARFTWCLRMDPQIAETYGSATYAIDHAPERLEAFERHGDALGIHVHAWRWREDAGTWTADWANEPWLDECVDVSLEAFRKRVGRECRISRLGDAWMDTRAMNRLEALGIRVDIGLEPGLADTHAAPGELRTGRLADLTDLPREPYRPSRADFRLADADSRRALWALPLTSAPILPKPKRRSATPAGGPRRRPLSMWIRGSGPNRFDELLIRALAEQRRPYLAFAVRTDLGVLPQVQVAFAGALQALLSHPARRRFVFCGPEEALARLGCLDPGARITPATDPATRVAAPGPPAAPRRGAAGAAPLRAPSR